MTPTYKDKERRQDRLTYQDTIDRQGELLELLGWKIRKNVGLSDKEAKIFPKLLGDAFLSQGNKHNIHYEVGNNKVFLGQAHSFALRMRERQGAKQKVIVADEDLFTVSISELWQLLYDSCLIIFPSAIEEAIHISKEIPHRERGGTYEFSVDKDLESDK